MNIFREAVVQLTRRNYGLPGSGLSARDKSFNQGAWEGLVKYAEEKGISHQYYQPTEKSTTCLLYTSRCV